MGRDSGRPQQSCTNGGCAEIQMHLAAGRHHEAPGCQVDLKLHRKQPLFLGLGPSLTPSIPGLCCVSWHPGCLIAVEGAAICSDAQAPCICMLLSSHWSEWQSLHALQACCLSYSCALSLGGTKQAGQSAAPVVTGGLPSLQLNESPIQQGLTISAT